MSESQEQRTLTRSRVISSLDTKTSDLINKHWNLLQQDIVDTIKDNTIGLVSAAHINFISAETSIVYIEGRVILTKTVVFLTV